MGKCRETPFLGRARMQSLRRAPGFFEFMLRVTTECRLDSE